MATIWVIKDDVSIREGRLRASTADGFDTSAAATVAGVADLPGVPDVVLLDVNLPDGSGFDLGRTLVTVAGSAPGIVIAPIIGARSF